MARARRTCVLRGIPCAEHGTCQVHEAFTAAQRALLGVLAATTLRDVAEQGPSGFPPMVGAHHLPGP